MSSDLFIVLMGASGFLSFLLAQAVIFRFIPTGGILKAILYTALAGLFLQSGAILLAWVFAYPWMPKIEAGDFVIALLLADVIYGLMVFVYVLCIFGPFETSIRMRLIRELAEVKQGLSKQELLARYNARGILEVRLARLLGAKDIEERDGKYFIKKRQNMFFILDQGAALLSRWIGKGGV